MRIPPPPFEKFVYEINVLPFPDLPFSVLWASTDKCIKLQTTIHRLNKGTNRIAGGGRGATPIKHFLKPRQNNGIKQLTEKTKRAKHTRLPFTKSFI